MHLAPCRTSSSNHIANESRVLLPRIHDAYLAKDLPQVKQLTQLWLDQMTLLNHVVSTEPWFLLGPWLAAARASGNTPEEQRQLEFDALSILLEWCPRGSQSSGVHDYANREWNGLLDFYCLRWQLYFTSLEEALAKDEPPKSIDWFAVDEDFSKQTHTYPVVPAGNTYKIVRDAIQKRSILYRQR